MKNINLKNLTEQGSMMVEALAMLGLITMVTPILYKKAAERTTELQDINIATQMRLISSAADQYIKDHYNTLINDTNIISGAEQFLADDLTMDKIKGYLPEGFNTESSKLFEEPTFRTFWKSFPIQVGEEEHRGISFTTSIVEPYREEISRARSSKIASMIGVNGGNYHKEALPDEENVVVHGVQGIWQIPLSDLGVDSAGNGGIVVISSEAINAPRGDVSSDEVLYRSAGSSTAQRTMHATLFMEGNPIDQVSQLIAKDDSITIGDENGNKGGLVVKGVTELKQTLNVLDGSFKVDNEKGITATKDMTLTDGKLTVEKGGAEITKNGGASLKIDTTALLKYNDNNQLEITSDGTNVTGNFQATGKGTFGAGLQVDSGAKITGATTINAEQGNLAVGSDSVSLKFGNYGIEANGSGTTIAGANTTLDLNNAGFSITNPNNITLNSQNITLNGSGAIAINGPTTVSGGRLTASAGLDVGSGMNLQGGLIGDFATFSGDIEADNATIHNTLNVTDLAASRNVTAGSDITAGGNVTANQNITAEHGNITAGGNVTGDWVYAKTGFALKDKSDKFAVTENNFTYKGNNATIYSTTWKINDHGMTFGYPAAEPGSGLDQTSNSNNNIVINGEAGIIEIKAPTNGSERFIRARRFVSDQKYPEADAFHGKAKTGLGLSKSEKYDYYQVDPAYTSVMNDIKLSSRGGARLSDILPDYINKGIYVVDNSYDDSKIVETNESAYPIVTYEEDAPEHYTFKIGTETIGSLSALDEDFSCGLRGSTCQASPWLGFVPAPLCPPNYDLAITLTPFRWKMAEIFAVQKDLNLEGSTNAANKEKIQEKFGAYDSTADSTKNFLQYRNPQQVYDPGSRVKTYSENGQEKSFEILYGASRPAANFQTNTWLNTTISAACNGSNADNNKDCGISADEAMGWHALMGFMYHGTDYAEILSKVIDSSKYNPDNIYWNVFPIYAGELAGIASTYCVFNRHPLTADGERIWQWGSNTPVLQIDQLNNFRKQKTDKDSNGNFLDIPAIDPQLPYKDQW